MKTTLHLTFSILVLIIYGCSNTEQPNEKTAQNKVRDSMETEDGDLMNTIDYDKTKVLQTVYVIDRSGTELKQKADTNSKTLGKYEFGAKLDVIEETEDWYGVRERISREFFRNGTQIKSTGWEKVYVLKRHIGSSDQIKLIPSDLNIISSLTKNQKTDYFDTGKPLQDYLDLELIDKTVFDKNKSRKVNFLLADTNEIEKKNGVIELKCQNKTIKYIDKPDAETEMQIFNYIGQYEFLNKYLISRSYWESGDYVFVDKNSGEETQKFEGYPYISADKKHIISIYTNPYEKTGDLELYSIKDKHVKHLVSVSFKNWMPIVEPQDIFWSTDNYLYLAVNHVNSFWKQDGTLNEQCQYIRIKIL